MPSTIATIRIADMPRHRLIRWLVVLLLKLDA